MHQILDFMRAAAPWAAMGSLLAILAVRGAAEKKKGKRRESDYSMEGMCLGMCFGTALGNDTGVGSSLGMLIGLVIGLCIPRKSGDEAA